MEVKSEAKLQQIFEQAGSAADDSLLNDLIEHSFRCMRTRFLQDCFHHNAHINYLKISPTLRFALNALSDKIDSIISTLPSASPADVYQVQASALANGGLFAAIRTFFEQIVQLHAECLAYVEAASIQKFFVEHLFGSIGFDRLVRLSFVCVDFVSEHVPPNGIASLDHVLCACDCIVYIINLHAVFNQSDSYYTGDKCSRFFEAIIDASYRLVFDHLADNQLIHRNALSLIMEQQQRTHKLDDAIETRYAKAIFLGKFIEQHFDDGADGKGASHTTSAHSMQTHRVSLN